MAAPKGNQFALGNNGGRPRLYETAKDMLAGMEEYFTYCEDSVKPLTISGLAFSLGMSTKSLRDYNKQDEFSPLIKRARQLVEMSWEELLIKGGSGPIFWMKNNANYADKIDSTLTGKDGKDLIPEHSLEDTARRLAFILIQASKEDDNAS